MYTAAVRTTVQYKLLALMTVKIDKFEVFSQSHTNLLFTYLLSSII